MRCRDMIRFKKAVVLIAFFLFPLFALTQNGILKGPVYDEFDSPLPGAEIKLVSDLGTISLSSIEGKYFMEWAFIKKGHRRGRLESQQVLELIPVGQLRGVHSGL